MNNTTTVNIIDPKFFLPMAGASFNMLSVFFYWDLPHLAIGITHLATS